MLCCCWFGIGIWNTEKGWEVLSGGGSGGEGVVMMMAVSQRKGEEGMMIATGWWRWNAEIQFLIEREYQDMHNNIEIEIAL